MRLRRILRHGVPRLQILAPQGWVDTGALASAAGEAAEDALRLLALPAERRARVEDAAARLEPAEGGTSPLLPFAPRSFRDFMLYEAHAIDAARGLVQRFMPAAARIVSAYETVARSVFPALRPHALWYRQPIYYMGNHLNFAADGEEIAMPPYADALDYELELGFVLAHPLRDAAAETAEAAIGGFVVLNDLTARNVQLEEMRSGFGPQKSKHFASAMSPVLVSADEILPRWRRLAGSVRVNGALVSTCSAAGARYSLGEVLAHASRGEQLHAGELFGTGTLPGGSGIETGRLLARGDKVELAIEGIGEIANAIV